MITFVRLVRVLMTLALAAFTVAFIIGLARPDTGIVEKLGLLALVAACIFLAARVWGLGNEGAGEAHSL